MSCTTMLPPPYFQQGLKDDEVNGEDPTRSNTTNASTMNTGNVGSTGTSPADLMRLESILVQEEQRRRALLLAAFPVGAGGRLLSSSIHAANPAAALLFAERQRASMFANDLQQQLSPMDRLILMHQRAGGLGATGGLHPGIFHPLPGAGNTDMLIGQHQWGQAATMGDALSMLTSPSALLLADYRQREEQQSQAAALSSAQGARRGHYTHDQHALDAMERGGKKGRTGTFPQKLHQMLTDLETEEGGKKIASFLPHGHSFFIHDPSEFVKTIMPKYFRMSCFASFQRQLNLYEFNRVAEGPDKGAYFHELFHHGRPVLASQIRRNKIKGEGGPLVAKGDKLSAFATREGQSSDPLSSLLEARKVIMSSAATSTSTSTAAVAATGDSLSKVPPTLRGLQDSSRDAADDGGCTQLVATADIVQKTTEGAEQAM